MPPRRSRCRSSSCSSATSGRSDPIRPRPGTLPPAPLARAAAGSRSHRLAVDRGPGHRGWGERRRGHDAVPVGLRLGRAWPRSPRSSGRSGTSSTRSRRSTTSARGSSGASGSSRGQVADYPARLGRWPAVIGFVVVVWLELVLVAGPQVLFIVLVGYTALTLAMMAQFGRDTWRAQRRGLHASGSGCSAGSPRSRSSTRPAGSGAGPSPAACSSRAGPCADVVIVALAVGSILFDGLSQTQIWFDLFGCPGIAVETVLLAAFLGLVIVAAAGRDPVRRRRRDGRRPAADRRRLPDRPLPDLPADRRPAHPHRDLGPAPARLGPVRDRVLRPAAHGCRPASCGPCSSRRSSAATCWARGAATSSPRWRRRRASPVGRSTLRQVPLAVVMVALTTLTLWSLGQAIVVTPEETGAVQAVATSRG